MRKVKKCFVLCSCVFFSVFANAQEPNKKYTLAELEAVFLQSNYQILAEKFEIDKADAELLESKLWTNPNLSISEFNLWANGSSEELPYLFGRYGNKQQISVELEQMIETAGKRRKRFDLKTSEKNSALLNFESSVRDLKLELRNTFIELQTTTKKSKQLQHMVDYFSELTQQYKKQAALDNVPRSDYFRMEAALIDVKNQLIEIQDQQAELVNKLELFTTIPGLKLSSLNFPADVAPMLSRKIEISGYEYLLEQNIKNKLANNELIVAQNQLVLEKANKVPDVTVQINYDRAGNIMRDFIGVGVGMDLPLFNKNKANIQIAKATLEQKKLDNKGVNVVVRQTVERLLEQMKRYEKALSEYPQENQNAYQQMMDNYGKHLKSKQITMLEFIDFSQSFVDAQQAYYSLQENYLKTFEELQYTLGKDF